MQISLRDLYVQIQQLDRAITGLSAEVKMASQQQILSAASFAQQLATVREDLNDHELRIRTQEARQYVSPKNMWTALGIILPLLASVITIVLTIVLNH